MRRTLRSAWRTAREVVGETAKDGGSANVPMMAAAISYYLLVTLAPLALLLVIGAQLIRPSTAVSVQGEGAALAEAFSALSSQSSWVAWALWLGLFLFGATGVFSQFVAAVGRIWNEPPRSGPLATFARRRFIAFLLLCVLALGLFASLVVGAALSAITVQIVHLAETVGVPAPEIGTLAVERFFIDLVASFTLFVTAFSLVPERRVRARDVVSGAAVTALGFALGQVALAYYLSTTGRVELAGALGNLVAVMLWAYYSAMIALYGATLSRVLVLRKEQLPPAS